MLLRCYFDCGENCCSPYLAIVLGPDVQRSPVFLESAITGERVRPRVSTERVRPRVSTDTVVEALFLAWSIGWTGDTAEEVCVVA